VSRRAGPNRHRTRLDTCTVWLLPQDGDAISADLNCFTDVDIARLFRGGRAKTREWSCLHDPVETSQIKLGHCQRHAY